MAPHRVSALATAIVAASAPASADVFAFKDRDGFERCMHLDHLIETTHTANGEQHRVLDQDEIQPLCVEAAVKLLAPGKDKDLIFEFVKLTKELSAHVQALPLIGLLVETALPMCNEIENYEVILRPLDEPPDRWAFPRARSIIKRCLKNAEFAKDFKDELASETKQRAANACAILLEEKLVKACKGSK